MGTVITLTVGELVDAWAGLMALVNAYIKIKQTPHAAELGRRMTEHLQAPYDSHQRVYIPLMNQYGKRDPQGNITVSADTKGFDDFRRAVEELREPEVTLEMGPIPVSTAAVEQISAAALLTVLPLIEIVPPDKLERMWG